MVGQTIAHYHVLEKLGEGGMGVVYKARDAHLDRFVAIKVLPPEKTAGATRKGRFVQEAKAASALNHPNIITIYDISNDAGRDFIAMEYVAGKTLDQLIPRKGMRLNEALKIAVQIADALSRAHSAGIIHRDLKPSNVMVDEHGLVKVLDFGLAKLTEQDTSDDGSTATVGVKTEEGAVVGTAAYMSPEQAEGKPVDARSDIFSFGSLLYEMVTGERPFRGDSNMSTLAAIINQGPASLPAGTPHDLEKLITRCLRKDLNRRFQYMKDLKVELEDLMEESDSGKLVVGGGLQPVAAKRRRPLAAAGLAAVLVLAALAWRYMRPRPEAEAPLNVAPLTTFAGLESEPSFSPDGNEVVFVWNGEKRDNLDIYRQLIGPGKPLRLTSDPAADFSPVWSPDGRLVAFLRDQGQEEAAVVLMPALGGNERVLAETRASRRGWDLFARFIDWSADGKWLVVCDGRSLVLLSVETGEKRKLTAPADRQRDRDPAFSPDGRSLALVREVSNAAQHLYRMDLSSDLTPIGEPERLTIEGRMVMHPVWTPDGREIIFGSGYWGNVSLFRIAARVPGRARHLSAFAEGVAFPSVSRRGNRLVFARHTLDPDIWRVEVPGAGGQSGPPTKLIYSTRYDAFPQYSPDGKRIAFESHRSGNPEIWVSDSDGGNARQLTSFGQPYVGSPTWSPDGRQVAFNLFGREEPDIYVVAADGGQPRRLSSHPARDTVPTWSHDGRWIYFTSNRTGSFEIWKLPAGGGEEVQVTRQGGYCGRESADGKWIYYAKDMQQPTTVWQARVGGGDETRVLDGLSAFGNFAVADEGIYYATGAVGVPSCSLNLFKFAARRSITLATIEKQIWGGLSVSPDRRYLLCTLLEHWESDLMLVENFR